METHSHGASPAPVPSSFEAGEARVVAAIQLAIEARSAAAEAEMIADIHEAQALLASSQSSDAKRRAEATLASANARVEAERAKAKAFGAQALVEYLTHRRDHVRG